MEYDGYEDKNDKPAMVTNVMLIYQMIAID
jgi:hypothetical protein